MRGSSTWLGVIEELTRALAGRSLLDPSRAVEHPLEALYVTGHSLGGAMALPFALALTGGERQAALAERLRAVYTFGQPMALCAPMFALLAPQRQRRSYRYSAAEHRPQHHIDDLRPPGRVTELGDRRTSSLLAPDQR